MTLELTLTESDALMQALAELGQTDRFDVKEDLDVLVLRCRRCEREMVFSAAGASVAGLLESIGEHIALCTWNQTVKGVLEAAREDVRGKQGGGG